jgi:hypothetical protein
MMTEKIKAFEQNAQVRKLGREAQERLVQRIIGLDLLPLGAEGGDEYLKRFGRGISAAKCAALAVACASRAEGDFAYCGLPPEETKRCLIAFVDRFQREAEALGGLL